MKPSEIEKQAIDMANHDGIGVSEKTILLFIADLAATQKEKFVDQRSIMSIGEVEETAKLNSDRCVLTNNDRFMLNLIANLAARVKEINNNGRGIT